MAWEVLKSIKEWGDSLHTPRECEEIASSSMFLKDLKEEKNRLGEKRINKLPNKKLPFGTSFVIVRVCAVGPVMSATGAQDFLLVVLPLHAASVVTGMQGQCNNLSGTLPIVSDIYCQDRLLCRINIL